MGRRHGHAVTHFKLSSISLSTVTSILSCVEDKTKNDELVNSRK